MKNLSKILCICAGVISANLINLQAKTLLETLTQYCVPTVGNCDKKATYKENIIAPGVKKTWCDCANINKFYNSSNRSCENCILGSFATSDYKEKDTSQKQYCKYKDIRILTTSDGGGSSEFTVKQRNKVYGALEFKGIDCLILSPGGGCANKCSN